MSIDIVCSEREKNQSLMDLLRMNENALTFGI